MNFSRNLSPPSQYELIDREIAFFSMKGWDTRPWTPELRAEREALSLIQFRRDQGQPQSEWLAALSADQTLSEPVRQRALQFAREWKP